MALQKTRFRGKVRIHGRPKEQAKAEIMLMKQREAYENRKSRRMLFTLLDILAILAFLIGIYNIYMGELINGLLLIGVGVIIIVYFILRKILKRRI